jgi:hypothetical protein
MMASALVFPSIGSRHALTPRGAVRLATLGIARLALQTRSRRLKELDVLFGEAPET